MNTEHTPDWYDRRNELRNGMIFRLSGGGFVMLDGSVPGDGTKMYVADWADGWAFQDSTCEPGDLIGEPMSETDFRTLLSKLGSPAHV